MKVIILGAGASKAYEMSKTRIKMPVANDFFKTFQKLHISEDGRVLIGFLLNYLHRFHNMEWLDFLDYNEDIEKLHSEIEGKLKDALSNNNDFF